MRPQRAASAAQLARTRTLFRSGFLGQQFVDQAAAKYAEKNGMYQQASAELDIASKAVEAAAKGAFYDGQRLVGELSERRIEAGAARARLALAKQALASVEERTRQLVYRAPFAGIVKRADKSLGSTVTRGEVILQLEQHPGVPTIDAYLTQSEVRNVQMGSRGKAYIAALDKTFAVQVIGINRSAGFVATAQSGWRQPDERSALVQLALLQPSLEQASALTAGMPVHLILPKRRSSSISAFLDPPAAIQKRIAAQTLIP